MIPLCSCCHADLGQIGRFTTGGMMSQIRRSGQEVKAIGRQPHKKEHQRGAETVAEDEEQEGESDQPDSTIDGLQPG
jgi:hypothetical protein